MSELRRPGPKPKPVGTRVRDHHTVAAKLPKDEWDKLLEIERILQVHAGRFVSDKVIEIIRAIDLNELRAEHPQEALIPKAS